MGRARRKAVIAGAAIAAALVVAVVALLLGQVALNRVPVAASTGSGASRPSADEQTKALSRAMTFTQPKGSAP
jgi:hypothetical protein